MQTQLTKQDILELFKESDRRFSQWLREGLQESHREFEERLAGSLRARKEPQKQFDKRLERASAKSRKEFNKKLGELTDTWGRFVEELVKPNSVELFNKRGIEVSAIFQGVLGKKDNKDFYQIDLFLVNDGYADKYAYKNGLFVLCQRGNMVEIVNDEKFKPREWKIA